MAFIAPVAQLDRASPSEGGDCAFESRRVHQKLCRRIAGGLIYACAPRDLNAQPNRILINTPCNIFLFFI